MSSDSEQHGMLSFLAGRERFNYRVAGIAVREGHVLTCREDGDDYVLLPGGRVEFGEASAAALGREIREELKCAGDVGRLLYHVENFFERDEQLFHEIGFYYAVTLPEEFPFAVGEPCLVTEDEGHDLSFEWVRAEADMLGAFNLLPVWLRGGLADLPDAARHVILDER